MTPSRMDGFINRFPSMMSFFTRTDDDDFSLADQEITPLLGDGAPRVLERGRSLGGGESSRLGESDSERLERERRMNAFYAAQFWENAMRDRREIFACIDAELRKLRSQSDAQSSRISAEVVLGPTGRPVEESLIPNLVRPAPPAPSAPSNVNNRGRSKSVSWAPLPSTNRRTMSGSPKLPSPYKSRSLLGNFIPVTTTSSSSSSLSPTTNNNVHHKKPSLTLRQQYEMDKQAAVPQQDNRGRAGATKSSSGGAAGSSRSVSPTKGRGFPLPPQTTPLRARSRSPTKAASGASRPGETQLIGVSRTATAGEASARKLSRSSGEIVIGLAPSSFSQERGVGQRGVRGGPPAPINTSLARAYGQSRAIVRDGGQRPVVLHHPTEREPSPERRAASQVATLGIVASPGDDGEGEEQAGEPGSADFSSVYSQDYRPSPIHPTVAQSLGIEEGGPSMSATGPRGSVLAQYPSAVSPLLVRKDAGITAPYPKHASLLEEYEKWRGSTTPEVDQVNQHHGDGESGSFESSGGVPAQVSSADTEDRGFQPIAALISGPLPARVASKTLIGEHGWLEDTTSGLGKSTAPTGKSRKLFGKFVQKTKDMMAGGNNPSNFGGSAGAFNTQRKSDGSAALKRNLQTSLVPREQCVLYCELDWSIASSLEIYIQSQFARGRVNLDVIKRTAENWARKGRPKVIGFRYDAETQLEIMKLHVNDFKWCGRYASNPAILGVLDSARANAKLMAVRTYCYPDTVLAKWLVDAQNLYELIDVGQQELSVLQGIRQFFGERVQREENLAHPSRVHGFPELNPLPRLNNQQQQVSRSHQQQLQVSPSHEQQYQAMPQQQQGSYQPQQYEYQEHPQQQSHAQPAQDYPATLYGYDSSQQDHGNNSSQQAYDSSSQNAYGSTTSQRAYGNSTNSRYDPYTTPQQDQRTTDRACSSPTKGFLSSSSPTKKQHIAPAPDFSSKSRSQRRRELIEPIMRKYGTLQQGQTRTPQSQDHHRTPQSQEHHRTPQSQEHHRTPQSQEHHRTPQSQEHHRTPQSQEHHRTAQPHQHLTSQQHLAPQQPYRTPEQKHQDDMRQAYAAYQTAYQVAARHIPMSSSEKTLRTSYSVQTSLNERQMAREREFEQAKLRRVRSRLEEEHDDSEFF